jgi:hypothetical protein
VAAQPEQPMPIAVLVLALVAYGYVVIAYPLVRRPALIGGALIAVIIAAAVLLSRPEETTIAAEELVLDQIAVERTGRGASVTGWVENRSPFRLRDMTLVLRLHDCASPDEEPEACPVIGESTTIARPDAPAGQIRAFAAHFIFSGVPSVVGTLRWEMSVAETRATGS